ncbi:MAG: hypothetical protein AABW50_02700 [Nanoarchaeota archaeon]
MKNKGVFTSEAWNDLATMKDPNRWYHLNEIAKASKKTPIIMEKRLDLAVKLKILLKKGIGRRIFYKLNPEDSQVKNMLNVLSVVEK